MLIVEQNAEVITFVWTIDFWNTYNFINTLTSTEIKEHLFIKMCTGREHHKLRFFIQNTKFSPKDQIDINK